MEHAVKMVKMLHNIPVVLMEEMVVMVGMVEMVKNFLAIIHKLAFLLFFKKTFSKLRWRWLI